MTARLVTVYAALVAATATSWAVAGVHGAVAATLVVAFVKVRYVGLEFMELRRAARPLRLAFEVWVIVVGAVVVATDLAA